MSYGQVEGYIIDTGILLPQPLESVIKSCSSFLKNNQKFCLITSSIKEEAFKLIEDSHDLILQHFQSDLKPFLDSQGIKEISNRDGLIIAEFFAEQKINLKVKAHIRSSMHNEFISAIENYLAEEIHSLPNGKKIAIDVFLASAATQLAIAKHTLEAPFEGLRCEEIAPSEEMKKIVASGAIIKNASDVTHLASSIIFQFRKDKWVVFVTTDQNDILNRQKEIREMFLLCSPPHWASDYYSDLTRNKAPLTWVNELHTKSQKQNQILETIFYNYGYP